MTNEKASPAGGGGIAKQCKATLKFGSFSKMNFFGRHQNVGDVRFSLGELDLSSLNFVITQIGLPQLQQCLLTLPTKRR